MTPLNASDIYFGMYATFQTADKRSGAALAGPDNAVGDRGTIEWRLDERKHRQAWLVNPYGQAIGFLDQDVSHALAVLQAKDWEISYILSFAAYSEGLGENAYWGQVAIIAYSPKYAESFRSFVTSFAREAAQGLRPDPSLSARLAEEIAKDPSSWKPSSKVRIPDSEASSVILKDRRSMHDKVLDLGRSKNVGCYIVSWAFILGIVACAIWLLHRIGVL